MSFNTAEAQSISLLLESLDQENQDLKERLNNMINVKNTFNTLLCNEEKENKELKERLGQEQFKLEVAIEKIENLERDRWNHLERIKLLEQYASNISDQGWGEGLSEQELSNEHIVKYLKECNDDELEEENQ